MKYIPAFKKPYSRISDDKASKAMGNIVDHVKISSLSGKDKLLFKKYFIADCKNKKIGNIRGDGLIDENGLARVLRKAVDRKILPGKWVADRFKDLLTKGGTSLSSRYETPPDAQGSGVAQKTVSQKEKFHEMAIKRKEIEARTVKITEQRNKLCQPESQKTASGVAESKAGQGVNLKKSATAGLEAKTSSNGLKQKAIPDKNSSGPKKSGGIDRVGSKSNVAGKKGTYNVRPAMSFAAYDKPYVEPPPKNELSNNELPKLKGSDLGEEINSNTIDEELYSKEISEKIALAGQAYETELVEPVDSADTTIEKSKDSDLQFGGVVSENDSFGLNDQKNN